MRPTRCGSGRRWRGATARRAEVDSETIALLVERCQPGTTLTGRPELGQDVVIAGLFGRLWSHPPPAHRFRSLQSMCALWADEFEGKTVDGCGRLDPGLARAGMVPLRELPTSTEQEVLMCTDLHAGNVLAARREPWLVLRPRFR